ncbi:MAG TPA: metallophosphoesterase, partial [Pirellulales bacterium]|nr:metallophosphoesterase [Pirellulales bacterium]
MPRIIAIGDIHGCSPALRAIETAIQLSVGDTLVVLGDFIDRGPDSKGVIDALLAIDQRCELIPILGNHEEMLLLALEGRLPTVEWLAVGGLATLESYRPQEPGAAAASSAVDLAWIPPEHIAFLRKCRDYYETDTHLLLHANYDPSLPLDEQDGATI